MNWNTFRLEFDEDDTLNLRGFEGRREAICPVCREPIQWCLDPAAFTTLGPAGDHTYAHARCLWEHPEDAVR